MMSAKTIPAYTRGQGRSRGFTLIELLVVIAIIALLVSILLPSLTKAKELAARAVCASNLHHIGASLFLYANDFDGFFPDGDGFHDDCSWSGNVAFNWPNAIGYSGQALVDPYVDGEGALFFCPANKDPLMETYKGRWMDSAYRGGDTGYFPYCGRATGVHYYWKAFPFLDNSPVAVETTQPDWFLFGDLSCDILKWDFYNSHGLEEGGNWLTAAGAVTWFERAEINCTYVSPFTTILPLLYPFTPEVD